MLTELIFDRTQADVLSKTEKGYYGSKDLNRVENTVAQLQELAKQLGVQLQLETKTDWVLTDTFSQESWPTKRQMRRYLSNVAQLCAACGIQMPLPTTMEGLDWVGANQIEEALHHTGQRIKTVTQTFHFSGELFAGEENIL